MKHTKDRTLNIFFGFAGALLLGLTPASYAQEAFDEDGAESEDEDSISMVMVSAGKRNDLQDAQDVATGVAVYLSDTLENLSLLQPEQLAAFIPSGGYSPSAAGLVIRGLGGLSNHPGTSSSAPLFEDGTYYQGTSLPLSAGSFLSQRVEILRGAQDASYGHGATGGTLERVSRRPDLDGSPDYHARVRGGQFGRQDMSLTFSGAFTDVFGYRVTAVEANRGGIVENQSGGDDLDTVGTKYQEFQIQLGNGETTRLWLRTFHLNQDSLPTPLIQASLYYDQSEDPRSGSTYGRSRNPYDGYTVVNPALTERRSDFVTNNAGQNLAQALAAGSTANEFYGSINPKTLNNLDNPGRVNQNFAGSESLNDTDGSILHWDLDFGSYARLSLLGARNKVVYSKEEDGDRINNTNVDIRTATDRSSNYVSREARFGTQGKRTLSWMVGSYQYDEDSTLNVRSYDNAFTSSTDPIMVDANGRSTLAGASAAAYQGIISEFHSDVLIDAEDSFASLALDFGGFTLSVATRSADSKHTSTTTDLTGYAGSGNAWAAYRATQWEYLKQGASGASADGEEIDSRTFTRALEFAGVLASNVDFDPATPFYGTEDIGQYIAVFDRVLECLSTETNGPSNCGALGVGTGYNADIAANAAVIRARALQQGLSQTVQDADSASIDATANASYALNSSILGTTSQVLLQQPYLGTPTPNLWGCLGNHTGRAGRCTSQTYTGDSTRSTVEISLGEGHLLYATALEGYRAGGSLSSNSNGFANPLYRPEKVEGTEFGLKLGWSKFKLNISGFDYEYTDMQSVAEHLRADGTLYQAPLNVAKADASGMELEFSWKLGDWAQLHLISSSMDGKVTSGSWTEPTGALAGRTIDLTNNLLPNSPESQWAVNFQIHLSQTVFWSVSRRSRGDTYFTVFNSPYAFMPEHEIVDARLVVRSRDDKVRLTIYGENLEETVSWNHAVEGQSYRPVLASGGIVSWENVPVNGGTGNSFSAITLNPPRVLGMQLDFRF